MQTNKVCGLKCPARDGEYSSESETDNGLTERNEVKGNELVNGIATTMEKRRADNIRLPNFGSIKRNQQCLKDVLVSVTSESSDDSGDDQAISDQHLQNRFQRHALFKNYQTQHYSNPEDYGFFDEVVFDDEIMNMRDDDDVSCTGSCHSYVRSSKLKKKAQQAKNPEVMAMRRRKIWVMMLKKELGKVQRAKINNHKEMLTSCKRVAQYCMKHCRQKAMQNMLETVWPAKRLTHEMQAYWKKYERVEQETRHGQEEEAEDQCKLDGELTKGMTTILELFDGVSRSDVNQEKLEACWVLASCLFVATQLRYIIQAKHQQQNLNSLTETELYTRLLNKYEEEYVVPLLAAAENDSRLAAFSEFHS